MFKNETREREFSRKEKQQIAPGPDKYIKETPKTKTKKAVSVKEEKHKEVNYKHFKDIITKVMGKS